MSDFKLSDRVSFFTWADSRSIDFKPDSLNNAAKRKIMDLDPCANGSSSDLVNDLVNTRRKKFRASEQLKKEREKRLKVNNSVISIESTAKSPASTYAEDDEDEDDEWSDLDELELSRNISIIEQNINQKSFGETSNKQPETSDIRDHQGLESAMCSSISSDKTDNEDEIQWSDCDEDISRNWSLIEQNVSFSSSKPDRSALQEISNLSGKDLQ